MTHEDSLTFLGYVPKVILNRKVHMHIGVIPLILNYKSVKTIFEYAVFWYLILKRFVCTRCFLTLSRPVQICARETKFLWINFFAGGNP